MAARTFTLKGVAYESVPLEDFDFDEIHEFQRVSGVNFGRAPLELAENNGDAWKAWLLVCMRRTNPDITERDFKGVKLTDVLETFVDLDDLEEEPLPDPPTAPPSENGGNGGGASPTEPTPENSGTPHGSTISA